MRQNHTDLGYAIHTEDTPPLGLSSPAESAVPKRVLYIDHTAKMSGGEIALLHLVLHLDRSRFEPVVVLASDGPLRGELEAAGVETHLLSAAASVLETRKDALGLSTLLRLRDVGLCLRYVLSLTAFIRSQNICLVHTNSLKSDILGGMAARLARIPLLWHVRDRIDEDYLPPPIVWVFRRLCRWLPDYVVANSQATLATLALTAKERSAAIYSGIEVDSRLRVIHDGVKRLPLETLRASLTNETVTPDVTQVQVVVRPSSMKIGLIGRIARWKGQHIFLQAAAQVKRRYPTARFQIIGSALFDEQAYAAELQELVHLLELEECVEFLGFRSDVPALIVDLDVLVHASITAEPFGQVITEGMAAARPVVATDGGGAKEIVLHGETGLLVPMGDADAMASAILFLMDHPEAAQEMGWRGYQRACKLFSIERTVSKIEAIYEEMLQA